MFSTPWRRWRRYRTRQRAALRASNRMAHESDEQLEHDLATSAGQTTTEGTADSGARAPAASYGPLGRPLNKHSPFYIGFLGALGALVAIGLWNSLGQLATVLTTLLVAFFLTLALNPIVEFLDARGFGRGTAVALVFAGVVLVFTLIGLLVIPPVVEEGTQLAENAPNYLDRILSSDIVRDLDQNYDIVDKIQAEATERLQSGAFVSQLFGGVLGAGRLVATGLFQTFTVLILTLYFLASFPKVKHAAYQIVPASRRPRVISLSEEIMRRVGSYAIGQAAIATVNAVLSYIMMMIVGIPYAAVLAVVVGLLGLIPMVGATLGAVIVCIVALFDDPQKAIIAAIYYVIYQQVENYVIAPRVMQRTVSVPGAVTVVAALAGGTLLGVLGALLAIPVAAGLLLIYEEVLVPRQRKT